MRDEGFEGGHWLWLTRQQQWWRGEEAAPEQPPHGTNEWLEALCPLKSSSVK